MTLSKIEEIINEIKLENFEPTSIIVGGFHADALAKELKRILSEEDRARFGSETLSGFLSMSVVFGLPVFYVGDFDLIAVSRKKA